MVQAIETFHLGKSFAADKVLQDLTITINDGEVVGLLGLNGAGKSVTVKMLAGLLQPTEGSFAILGHQNPYSKRETKENVAYLSQSLDFPPDMVVKEVLTFCSSLYNNWDYELQDDLVKKFNLPLDKNVQVLSIGLRLRLALACVFCQRAKVILLDEPTGNLDPMVRNEFLENLASVLERYNPAVVFATHLLEPLERIATRVVFLKNGNNVFDEKMENIEERYRKVQVIFPEKVPEDFVLPSSLSSSSKGRVFEALLMSCFTEGISRACERYDASFDIFPVSLEDLFLALHSEEG